MRSLERVFVFFLAFFGCMAIAIGADGAQDAAQTLDWGALASLLSAFVHVPPTIAPIMLGVMLAARGLAEALLAVGRARGVPEATTAGEYLANAATIAGKLIGAFGLGTPTGVVVACAEKLAGTINTLAAFSAAANLPTATKPEAPAVPKAGSPGP